MQNKVITSKKTSILLNFFLSLIFFVAFIKTSNAQTKKIKGSVVFSEKLRDYNGVYIQNLRTKEYTLTDLAGVFEIEVEINDILLFRGDFLSKKLLKITPQIFSKEKLIVVLKNEIINLDEVVANPPLTGNLKTDLASVAYIDTISALYSRLGIDIKNRDIQQKEKKESIFPQLAGIPIPTKFNIEAFYKLMTGYYEKQERLHAYNQLDETAKRILAIIPEDFFLKTLKIPQNEVFNFVFFGVRSDKFTFKRFLDENKYFEIKELLEIKSKVYLNRIQSNLVDYKNDSLN